MNTKQLAEKYNIDLLKRDVAFEASHLITVARAFAGLSQTDLAKRIGTKQSGISRAESGEVEPSISFLDKIAKAIGTEFIFYFSFQKDQKSSTPTLRYESPSFNVIPSIQSFALFPVICDTKVEQKYLEASFK